MLCAARTHRSTRHTDVRSPILSAIRERLGDQASIKGESSVKSNDCIALRVAALFAFALALSTASSALAGGLYLPSIATPATGTANVRSRTVTVAGEQKVDEHKIAEQGGDAQIREAKSADVGYISDDGRFYVQVAAYATEQNALKMIDELRQKNFSSARIHVKNSNGKLLYQVRIGPVPTSLVAEKLQAQLKEVKLDKSKVITYN